MRFLLTEKCPDGFPVSELCDKLASIKVQGFAPEKLGYKTVEKFVKAWVRLAACFRISLEKWPSSPGCGEKS